MFERLGDRADRIGAEAVERAKRRIVADLDEPAVTATISMQGVVLSGRRLSERLRWIGGLFR
jgi:hypothetical protein